ncbi:hypothetical protein WICMUC_000178 [Wickerhamomyces mucosus]|uniref:Mitochondrial presequence protease n=1 Tax=Wickerhamomyces mucosus TaxID=1378264 RepID=A0A9P8Q0V9_9ASCO|nr:hypothetical protein WICMUC_000178 [Wickerhamomyces mucosus]
MSSLELLTSFDVEYAPSSVKKWRSKRTGLQAVIIDKESPIVNGFFAVATEVEDDSGTPHTLEHLVFMGSKKYPYKGLLDTLGNVAFSNTNAWTATDQTVYTLTTAGWEGFKLLLPIYLDHILNPTLTDEACYTEVYHVDGEGKEKGVVFSEMQGIQNQSWFLTALNSQREAYHPKSGYSSETGGLMENLRVLSNDKIREFHQSSYRPSNLCVIVNGSVDEDEFLKIINEFDNELPSLENGSSYRPFVDSPYPIKPLPQKIVKTIEFPEKDESYGEITITWVGPKHENWDEDLAITLLLEYLTDSSISLLIKNLVEIDEPLASDIHCNTDDYTYTMPYIGLNNVPTNRLHEAHEKLLQLLNVHATVDQFDLVKMREVVENSKLKLIFAVEKSADILSDYVITDFLYSDLEGQTLGKNLRTLRDYESISKWTTEQWVELFQRYLVNNNPVIIVSKPSKALYKSNKEQNKKLLKDRIDELGEEGLNHLKEKLKNSQEKNDLPIPQDILDQFPKPDPSKIQFIDTLTIGIGLNKDVENDLNNKLTSKYVNDTPKDFPLYINIDQFKSEFISIDIILSSAEISQNLLPYFELYSEIFTFPLEIDGQIIPFEQVIKDIQNDTISTSLYNGFDHQFNELISAKIQVKKENYIKAINWFKKIFYFTKFDKSRVKVTIEKIINGLPSLKRSGSSALSSVQTNNTFTERSLYRSKDFLYTESFYRELLNKIENGKFDDILKDLEDIRTQLFKLNNIRVIISGDLSQVEHPIKSWNEFIDAVPASSSKELITIPRSFEVLTDLGQSLSGKTFIITTPGSESTFLTSNTKIPIDYLSRSSVAVSLAASYLQAVEGPFWRGIRGTGLAYGANVSRNVEFGQLTFEIYRGSDAIKSYEVGSQIIKDFVNGVTKIDKTLFEGAVSSLINGIASFQSNYYAASSAKYVDNVLKKRGPNFNNNFIKELKAITEDDLIDVLKKYYLNLFDAQNSAVFISSHPSNANELKEYFESRGYEVSIEEVTATNDNDAESENGDEYTEEEDSDGYSDEDAEDDSEEVTSDEE